MRVNPRGKGRQKPRCRKRHEKRYVWITEEIEENVRKIDEKDDCHWKTIKEASPFTAIT